ncbi:AAA family ATPase [Pseudomonas sp. Irchel 3H9]|uniref:AAA family ATPase n=1 Tax=Pseudomonas sp. Irchel 3H9 TaxID=2009043 RepID=UPI000BA3CEF6|nr:AAA family ATPase [Pseudomonas sp. Irchel 3H9]
MLLKFSGKNYKAFDNFEMELKPLTILLGPNSSGKSALINSLLMLSQSADSLAISESPLRLNGHKTGMGETLNIVKDKNPNNKLSFTFTFDPKDALRKQIGEAKSSTTQNHETVVRYMGHLLELSRAKTPAYAKLNKKIEQQMEGARDTASNIPKATMFSNDYIKLIKLYRTLVGDTKKLRQMPEEFIFLTEQASLMKIQDCFVAFLALPISKIAPLKVSYSFHYNKRKETLSVSEYVQYNKFGNIIFKFVKEGNNITITSDVIDQAALNRSRSEIIKLFSLDSLQVTKRAAPVAYGFGGFSSFKGSTSPFAALITQFIDITSKHLLSSLAGLQVNHVSPLRAFPQRYYLLDKSIHHTKLNALEGTELAEILKNNPKIKDNVNILFARFNIGIDVEKVNDIIYKIVVNQNNVNLELTDVGFGISQVLPILVQAYLSPKNSITIIEQPEIHLHPNMQAWLADALISIALIEQKRFIIESHSDAIIRRIRLRIVDESSELTEDHVKIYYLHRDSIGNCTNLDDIKISDNGDVSWPKDFMDVEMRDTIEIQKMKYNRLNKGSEGVLQ